MNIKQTIRNIVVSGVLLLSLSVGASAIVAPTTQAAKCGGVDTALLDCGGEKEADNLEDTGLWNILLIVVNFLVAGVGVLATGGIVYGAVLYASSGGNPDQVKKARKVFTDVVIGVIAFAGMYIILNFLVPGGVFNQ